jgi:hypothetical protein
MLHLGCSVAMLPKLPFIATGIKVLLLKNLSSGETKSSEDN